VVPVGIVGSNLALPAKSLLVNPGPVHVKIGHPLTTEETAGLDRDQLAELTRQRVLALLGQSEDHREAQSPERAA
jgi:1-acyl-sn-glycerol-3-phosphate acyltransferase